MSLADLIGKEVGFVSVTKPQKHRRTYEFAAWWTDLESDVGTFPLVLERHPHAPYPLEVVAKLPARVIASYTQSHFGGMPYGEPVSPEKHADVGRRDNFVVRRDLVDAVGNGPSAYSDPIRFVVNRELWPLVEELTAAQMLDAAERVAARAAEFRADPADNWKAGGIRFAGKDAARFAEALERIREAIEFYSPKTDYARKIAHQNLSREFVNAYIGRLCQECGFSSMKVPSNSREDLK